MKYLSNDVHRLKGNRSRSCSKTSTGVLHLLCRKIEDESFAKPNQEPHGISHF